MQTHKTRSSELPQPIHTVSTINDTTHDISLLSDTSISDQISSQFSSPSPSQIANYPFNPPQGTIRSIERLLSQAHWNHSYNIVNSSPSLQSFPGTLSQAHWNHSYNIVNSSPSLQSFPGTLSQAHWNHSYNIVNSSPSLQSFPGTPPIITLSSNSSTPDSDQHSHHCIGKQPDTTRTYSTLPLKLDPKFIVPSPALFGDHNNGEQLHNWAKQRISKSYKITPVKNKELTNY